MAGQMRRGRAVGGGGGLTGAVMGLAEVSWQAGRRGEEKEQ